MNSTTNPFPESSGLLRVLMADDEPAARKRLRTQLGMLSDIEVVAECADGVSAVEAIKQQAPDLALLDVEMPGLDGIEVAKAILATQGKTLIIFVTAHEQHALKAFDVQAVDYLLKPYTKERLEQAVGRVRRLLASAPAKTAPTAGVPAPTTAPLNRIVVPTGERMLVVQAAQVDWIESAGNYAVIHAGADTHVLRETLQELEAGLAHRQFLRISRTCIVNLDRVRELRADSECGHAMILADGTKLAITRGIREVQKRLEHG